MFDDFAITRSNDSGYTITMYNHLAPLVIKNVMLKEEENSDAFDPNKWVSNYTTRYNAYNTRTAEIRDSVPVLQRIAQQYKVEYTGIYKGSLPSLDTINCFREMHKQWMPWVSTQMPLTDWLEYYVQHKEQLYAAYMQKMQDPGFVALVAKIDRWKKMSYGYRDGFDSLNLTSEDVQMPGIFSLSSLGTYNCDALQRLQDPVNLYVDYKDSKGQPLRPVVAMLIDSKINGIMRYDGSYGFSPYRIAYSPRSVSRMVLVDVAGKAYLVKPETFSSIDVNTARNTMHTFIAEPIKQAKNKSELRTLLSL